MTAKHRHLTHDQMMNTNPDEPFVKSSMTRDQELHVESHAPYLKVFAAWRSSRRSNISAPTSSRIHSPSWSLGLLFWAVIKASMVGWYFMHLKFEGNWVYYMLVPAGILAIILTTALIPDMAMQPVTEENPRRGRNRPSALDAGVRRRSSDLTTS